MKNIFYNPAMGKRFRGFLPVVMDVETGGFDPVKHAVLEIAIVILRLTDAGYLEAGEAFACHVAPFSGALLDPIALDFNGIIPDHPFRDAKSELDALHLILDPVSRAVKASGCHRAILVGHNAAFDLSFLNAIIDRTGFKFNPFHRFSTLDTVTLAAMAHGHTVLAKAVQLAGLAWDNNEAHSAIYDAERTTALFCNVMNRWQGYIVAQGQAPI